MARYISTTTPLGNAGVYTGTLDAGREDNIVGLVFSDQSGTLFIEQSVNGTNWDLSESIAVTGGAGQGYSKTVYAPYIRVRYVNGATPQTVFRLSARFSSAGDS